MRIECMSVTRLSATHAGILRILFLMLQRYDKHNFSINFKSCLEVDLRLNTSLADVVRCIVC